MAGGPAKVSASDLHLEAVPEPAAVSFAQGRSAGSRHPHTEGNRSSEVYWKLNGQLVSALQSSLGLRGGDSYRELRETSYESQDQDYGLTGQHLDSM